VVVVRSRPHLAAASAFGARGFLALRAGRNLPNLDDMWIDYNCTRRDGQLWQIGESFAHKGQWTRKAALILIAESIPLLGDVVTLLYSIPLLMPPYITLHNPTPHLPFPEGSVDTLSQRHTQGQKRTCTSQIYENISANSKDACGHHPMWPQTKPGHKGSFE